MKTSELSNDVQDSVLRLLPKSLQKTVEVRASSVNVKNGRCSFPFTRHESTTVSVAVVCKDGVPSGVYYVLPAAITPERLEVKPSDKASKWDTYVCDKRQLVAAIEKSAKRKKIQAVENICRLA